MRMMVCGCWKKVMGSKAPPALPAPYACIPSMLRSPARSSPPPRRCYKGTGCAEPRDAEYPRTCLGGYGCRSTEGWMDGWMDRWMAGSARRLVGAISPCRVFILNEFPRCPGSMRGQERRPNKPVL